MTGETHRATDIVPGHWLLSRQRHRDLDAPQKATRCWTFSGGLPEVERATATWVLTHFLVSQRLDSVRDPLVVDGVTWNLAMPAFAEVLKDEPIADLLTCIRHEWGYSAPAVKAVREATRDREDSWIEAGLLNVP